MFSNQTDFSSFLPLLDARTPLLTDTTRIAFLIGESHFLSLLPSLAQHADVVMLNDIDPLVRRHNRHLVRAIKQAGNREQFSTYYFDQTKNPALQNPVTITGIKIATTNGIFSNKNALPVTLDENILQALLNTQPCTFGERHFLHSEETFQATKAAMDLVKIVHTNFDLFTPACIERYMQAMARANESFEITVCNVFNLFEYDSAAPMRTLARGDDPWEHSGQLFESLDQLLHRSSETLMLYGLMNKERDYKCLTSSAVASLADYKTQMLIHQDEMNTQTLGSAIRAER